MSFAPGEAYQFDWSTDKIIINGEIVTVKVAHFVLCYSRKRFVYIYPNETHEMVFDAHIRAFEFFGGTPIRGTYDNMPTAVKKVLAGKEREWNPHFESLCAHYRVEPTACNPASGNEKGIVERQVKISREQFFTPMPEGSSLQELNDRLASQLATYNKTHKHPEFKDKTLDEVFQKEQPSLVSAPLLFDGCKETNIKISTTCLARFDSNSYSVHCSCAGKIVQCKSYADKVVLSLLLVPILLIGFATGTNVPFGLALKDCKMVARAATTGVIFL
ncbi:MAG: IS21 family transposase [Rickettsiales bacterium]|nr:IS21 family transposase [Pseudomonadota bacterium]MDA0965615.1 IS21 family transposase [Pseudomonadota bacterium]MDG4542939.1 IS21 family transposase [Rickettsiales bacterium]MDG4544613.1 IS21 family transposase [Rickettsiales bacterium]MDG4546735.1 IS21 family transposase [Rickettsiales bacterium]